jgi:predicted lipoprotein with Yx(FWY)xxD motif
MVDGPIKMLAVAALFPLVMGACSEEVEPGDGTSSPTESSEPTEEPAAATVAVEDSDFGEIVVDAEGRTLYVFLADTGSDSTCYDECEDSWPPLTVEGDPAAGQGIDASLLGTTEREDGSVQVTLDGHPLYYFGADETPDDINGQDVGDVWYVVSPEGEAIQE